MSFQWYVRINGVKSGPISQRELKQLAARGELKPDDIIRRDDREKWCLAGNVKGLFSPAPPKNDLSPSTVPAKKSVPQRSQAPKQTPPAAAAITDDFLDSLIPSTGAANSQVRSSLPTPPPPNATQTRTPQTRTPQTPAPQSAPAANDSFWDDLLSPGSTVSGGTPNPQFSNAQLSNVSPNRAFQSRLPASMYRRGPGFGAVLKENAKAIWSLILSFVVVIGCSAKFLWPLFKFTNRLPVEQLVSYNINSNTKNETTPVQFNNEPNTEVPPVVEERKKAYPVDYPGRADWDKGHHHYLSGRCNDAIPFFTRAIQKSSEYDLAYNYRALCHTATGEYDTAFEDINKALRIDSKYSLYYNTRGLIYYHIKQYDSAIKDFSKAIELNPKLIIAYNNRGLAYCDKGQAIQAQSDFQRALEEAPGNAVVHNNLGVLYYNEKQYDRALEIYARAIRCRPRHPLPCLNRGILYMEQERYTQARDDFGDATNRDEEFAAAYTHLGLAYLCLDRDTRALTVFAKALKIAPNDPDLIALRDAARTEKEQPQPSFPSFRKWIRAPISAPLSTTGPSLSHNSYGPP